MRVDNVDEVTDTSRRVVRTIQMNMDAAGLVGESPGFAEPPRQGLYLANVFPVAQDGADQLHTITAVGGHGSSPLLFLAVDAAVIHDFPNSAVWGRYPVSVIIIPGNIDRAVQIMCGGFCCFLPGDPGKLDFQTESFRKHLPSFLAVFGAQNGGGHGAPRTWLRTMPQCLLGFYVTCYFS